MKYPRTFHLPWSEGCGNDDKRASSVESLLGKRIIISEKMDGSNVCMTREACFSRSHSGPPTHASFAPFKALHASISNRIDPELEVFGEWCFALHSIAYDKLPSYFLTFGVRNIETASWLDWDEVKLWSEELSLATVPVLFDGECKTERELHQLTTRLAAEPSACGKEREGVVVRQYASFSDKNFAASVMKWVRKDHVQTDEHWKNQVIVKNGLAT